MTRASLDYVPVTRQRFSIEGTLYGEVPEQTVLVSLIKELSRRLEMNLIGEPLAINITLPHDQGEGTHVHANWTESGCDLYTWRRFRFATLDVYSCRTFSPVVVRDLFVKCLPVAALRTGAVVWTRWEGLR